MVKTYRDLLIEQAWTYKERVNLILQDFPYPVECAFVRGRNILSRDDDPKNLYYFFDGTFYFREEDCAVFFKMKL